MASKFSHVKPPVTPVPPVVRASIKVSDFDSLPDSAFVRQSQLVPNVNRPGIPVPLPFSNSTLRRMVRAGVFPQPIKVSSRLSCWKVSEVRAWMAAQSSK